MVYLAATFYNPTGMKLSSHQRTGTFIFWFAQILGGGTALAFIIFLGGTVITEIIDKVIDFKEDFSVFFFFFCEILVAVAFVISWRRKRLGAILVIVLALFLSIWSGRDSILFVYVHLPILFSGLLLLFYYYYKEWILKQKA